ncbi:MAG: DUF262 domain-containing protein [Thermodesulfobacteriota bacterium]|nr:DUF262 domain-containing protein [Thermodesulfobacteriota bacterium]
MAVERRVTTQDISWFLDLHTNDQLDLDPSYQRRSVWSPKDRRFFLDTIFRGYPSPSIFLHKQVVNGKTVYYVVDGKQRLETILKFAQNKIAIDKDYGDTRLAGKKWRAIKSDETLARKFWDYVLPVEFTTIVEDTTLVNEVFDRLNRNSIKLVDQELRHAKYEGWFITFVERESESSDWKDLGIVTIARAKRMRDVQFLSELLIILLKSKIGGFDQNEITEYYADYDDLADLDVSFDEEHLKKQFETAKKYLLELEREASIITEYARNFTNLYSLWGVVSLHNDRLPSVKEFSGKYSAFMEEVNKYRNEEYLSKVMNGDEIPSFKQSLKYYQNSTGASTEGPQRHERNTALLSVIFEATSP